MPPRIQLRPLIPSQILISPSTAIPSFLVPFLHNYTQSRNASILANLSDTPGSYSRKIRRGRGPSSGKGKTSGRGHKGQKQHGKVPVGMQGGQTADHVVHGKEGFNNIAHAVEMSPVNLDTIQSWIDQNRIDPSVPITLKELTTTRAIHGIKDGVKLLARGASTLTTPINIVVSRASQSAIEAVEAAGGTVTTRFYTKDAIRRIKMNTSHPFVSMKWDPEALGNPALAAALPEGVATDPAIRVKGVGFQYRLPDPTGRKELEYYRDPKHRGYLSHLVKEGEGPSLYFKPMPVGGWAKKEGTKSVKEKRREENRLW